MNGLLLAVALARCADMTTSVVGFQHGGIESHPFLPDRPALHVTMQTGIMTGQILALRAIEPRHPKLARALAWISIGVSTAAAFHNTRVIISLTPRTERPLVIGPQAGGAYAEFVRQEMALGRFHLGEQP